VGANDTVLTADSTTATGLKWAAAASVPESLGFTAGKNKIINGDFRINQRSFTSVTTDAYGFDRWTLNQNGNVTYTPQTFTAGTAPVTGYEAVNFARIATTSQNATTAIAILSQKIEDVRTLAAQTATLSFWAKAGSGTPKIALEVAQVFGSGGSSTVLTYAGQVTLSTSWARYSITVSVPSISGKTIGTANSLIINFWTSAGTNYNSRTGSLGAQDATIDLWGVQVEAGSVATAFQTATGTLAGELAACQRYYYQFLNGNNKNMGYGMAVSASAYGLAIKLPVSMRTTPTLVYTTGASYWTAYDGSDDAFDAWAISSSAHTELVSLDGTGNVSATQGTVQNFASNNASAAMGFSAEL
jgi:hypothetical protein